MNHTSFRSFVVPGNCGAERGGGFLTLAGFDVLEEIFLQRLQARFDGPVLGLLARAAAHPLFR